MKLGTKNSRFGSAGVSLVTVLLFMLVATIAATATFKWLTSENRSSGSRLQKQAAYQSAMAGIENARAWMTYNANDVGALIKQYKDTGKKIKLNDRLTPWLRANQNYDVWLTGVNTGTAHNFKLKILSSGKSAGGSVHNEIAIFNVDGLYRVQIPQESLSLNYDKAFQGGSGKFVGTDRLQSGIVNGDYKGNQPHVEKEFLVTGSIEYEGAASMEGDLYVGKDLKNKGATTIGMFGTTKSVVYVGGNLSGCDGGAMTVYGDLHVGGNISEDCPINVSGNLTIGGQIKRETAARVFTVGRNLVFKENGSINWTGNVGMGSGLPGDDYLYSTGMGVGGYSYLSKIQGMNSEGGRKIDLGQKIYLYNTSTFVACPNKDNGGSFRPEDCSFCEGFFTTCTGNGSEANDRYFSFKNTSKGSSFHSLVQTSTISHWAEDDNVLKNVSGNYWTNIKKMRMYGNQIAENDSVPIAIQLKDTTAWMNAAYSCDGVEGAFSDDVIDLINGCYTTAERNKALYNGFLILDLNFTEKKDPTKSLKGKFVFILRGNAQLAIPSTTKESVVMIYFPNGHANDIMPNQPECRGIGMLRECDPYNYFIYSKGDINQFVSWGNKKIEGSVVLASGILKTSQGGTNLRYNKNVMNALASAGIIKENPEYTKRVKGENAEAGAEVAAAGAYDDYYIAAAPQLNITLESQYANNEPLPVDDDQEELSQSFIILPRVIFLPSNPYGRLTDYFNVVNLNVSGSALVKDDGKIGGCDDIPKNSLLYDRDNPAQATLLPSGLHECQYEDNDQEVPFYVYVTGDAVGSLPEVHFDSIYKDMGANTVKYASLVCPAGSDEEFKVKVSKPNDLPANGSWTITPQATFEGACDNSSPFCTFKLHFSEEDCATPKHLFKVETNDATEGTVDFQIMECTGCQTGSPSDAHFSVSSSVLVKRSGLLAYCSGPGAGTDECAAGGDYYERMQLDWPDCDAGENSWVRAVGYNSTITNNCTLADLNESWTCGISSDIKFEAIGSGVPEGCEAIIPPEATNHLARVNLVAGDEEELYAQLKTKKVQLKVKFAGTVPAGADISVSSNRFATDQTCSNLSDGCSYWLFAGDEVSLTISESGKAEFSYWKCDPAVSTNCESEEPFTGRVFSIPAVNGNNEIVAWYGQKDKHCFFDEFTTAKECSGIGDDWKYCFNYCKDDALEECKIGNGELTDKAKWIVLGDGDLREKLQYGEGRIWLDSSYNRTKRQSEVSPLTVLSTAQAGFYGTLLAQFQVPRLGHESDESSVRVNKSGFLLRSSDDASSYVILNVFANKDGKLVAKACVGGNCSETKFLKVGATDIYVSSTDIVTMSAQIKKVGPKDELEISIVGGYYGNYETGRIHINLSDIPGYTSLSTVTNEYVGFSLADPAFKIYDIGWKSETYNAECWKTPPTVKCSFRAAYLGGIVPLGRKAQPWVGFSSWFDDKDCSPQYYYRGDDACQKTTSDYSQCSDLYTFEASGSHGAGDTRSAKVVVQECNGAYITERTRRLLYTGEALCGPFWVGATNVCGENLTIFSGSPRTLAQHTGAMEENIYSEGSELFALSGHANMRSSTLQVLLQNDGASEVEVYLRSETTTGYYGANKIVYSNPVVTTNSTGSVLSFNVDEMSNVAGFDPEHVTGVIIRNLGSSSITVKEIKTNCNFAPVLSCEDARYDAGKFKITVNVKNSAKASSYKVTAEENGSNASDLGLAYDCVTLKNCPEPNLQNKIVFNTANYDPYSSDAVKKYVFEVSMKTADGNVEKHVEGSPCQTDTVVISGATAECKWNGYDGLDPFEIAEGGGFPPFQYSVDCPPGKSCPYEILYETTKIHEGPGGTDGFISIPSNKTSDINSAEHPLTVNSQYTVSLRSKNGGVAFATCTKTFKIKKKPAAALALTCGLTNQTNRVVGVQQSTAGTVSATGCGTGETCTWAITEGSSTTAIGSGNFGQTPYNFTGANEVGLHTYKFKVTRASDGSADSCSFTVDYPLNLTCGTFSDPGATAPIAAGESVTPVSPTVTTGDVSGCNGNCSYEVTGGNNVSGGSGSNYTGTGTITSFTDTGVSGETSYNLVITHGTGTAAKTLSCPFTVTYASAGGTATCTLSGNGSYITGKTNVSLAVSNFSDIINTTSNVQGTFNCTPSNGNVSNKSVDCYPGNNSGNGECQKLTFAAPSVPGNYTCKFNANNVDLCGDILMNVADPFSCSIKQGGVDVTSVVNGSTIAFGVTRSSVGFGDASFNNCGIKISGSCWNNNNNGCNGSLPNSVNQNIQVNTDYSAITIAYSCNSVSNTSFRGCSKTISVTGNSGLTPPSLTTEFVAYSAGRYTLTTGANVGNGYPSTLHCRAAADPTTDRTIGTLGNCTIVIPQHQDRSNGHGCSVAANSTYTFVVDANPPGDLTCGIDN